MSVAKAAPMSRAVALSRTFAAAFEALKEYAKTNPAEVAQLYEAIAGHLRSAAPLTLLASVPELAIGPVVSPPAVKPETSVRVDLGDGASYHLVIADEFLRMQFFDVTGDEAMHHFTPEKAKAFRDDFSRVLAAMGCK